MALKGALYLCRAAAGIKAGVLAGGAMLGWTALASALAGRQMVWVSPNLLATLFFGPGAASRVFRSTSWSGLALYFVISGFVGLAFGLLAREAPHRTRLLLAGMAIGLCCYYLSDLLFWRTMGPSAAIFRAPRSMLAPYLLFGACLGGWYPSGRESIRRDMGI